MCRDCGNVWGGMWFSFNASTVAKGMHEKNVCPKCGGGNTCDYKGGTGELDWTEEKDKECICELLDKPTYHVRDDPHSVEKKWDCLIHGPQKRYWLIHKEKQPYCVPCNK